jgi:hypothetical protein
MAEFFEARRLRYEIHLMIEGRWRIETVIDDGRDGVARRFDKRDFEEKEKQVVEHANALLAGGQVQAVKVMRERMRADGFSTVAEIFAKRATNEPTEAPLTVGTYDGPVSLCETVDELCGRDGYRMVGTLLRGFLDRLSITPIELFHHHPYIRKLNDNYALVQGSVHQIARLQAKVLGGDPKTRAATLLKLVEQAEKRARDAMAERKLPVLEGGDLERLAARIEARLGVRELKFYTQVAVTRVLQGSPSAFGKLETVLQWLTAEVSEPHRELIDQYAACCLDNPALMKDLLGHRENLAAALGGLADLARGELSPPPAEESGLKILAGALAAGRLPLTVHAIWDRALREVTRGRPLCKNDQRREWTTLMKLSDRLTGECPDDFKEAMKHGFRARMRRLHEADVA